MRNEKGEKVSSAWAAHSSETDHINALKDLHDKAKYNPFLNDADFKEIANSEENYRILSKRDNTIKGAKNDWDIIKDKDNGLSDKARQEMAKQKVNADMTLHGKFATRTVQNMGKEFTAGARDTLINSAIPLTAEAVRKMCKVASGEEQLADAVNDMGKTVMNVAVAGGSKTLLLDVVDSQLRNSNNTLLSSIAGSSTVSKLIGIAASVNES